MPFDIFTFQIFLVSVCFNTKKSGKNLVSPLVEKKAKKKKEKGPERMSTKTITMTDMCQDGELKCALP